MNNLPESNAALFSDYHAQQGTQHSSCLPGTRIIGVSELTEIARLTAPLLCRPTVALSGGSTYQALMPLWARLHPACGASAFFPVDERMVPDDHPDSNWLQAENLLFKPLELPDQTSHRPHSASHYETLLADFFAPGPITFDALFLGVGEDGHTASLFSSDDLSVSGLCCIETSSPRHPHRRITLTAAVIARSRNLVVVIYGEGKQTIVRRLLYGDATLPVTAVLKAAPASTLYIQKTLLPAE